MIADISVPFTQAMLDDLGDIDGLKATITHRFRLMFFPGWVDTDWPGGDFTPSWVYDDEDDED